MIPRIRALEQVLDSEAAKVGQLTAEVRRLRAELADRDKRIAAVRGVLRLPTEYTAGEVRASVRRALDAP